MGRLCKWSFKYYDTYEEALETGLQQALKLVVKRLRMKVTLELLQKLHYDVLDIHYISFFAIKIVIGRSRNFQFLLYKRLRKLINWP
jgi:hypothetical protein